MRRYILLALLLVIGLSLYAFGSVVTPPEAACGPHPCEAP